MSIEVITGCMFSGKTSELIRRIRVIRRGGKQAIIFKPEIDNRYSGDAVVTHDMDEEKSVTVKSAKEILKHLPKDKIVIGIDEAQFFDSSLVDVLQYLNKKRYRIIVAGLDMDYNQKPFGFMPILLAIASEVTKLKAICSICGEPTAMYSERQTSEKETVLVGVEQYKAVCAKCLNRRDEDDRRADKAGC